MGADYLPVILLTRWLITGLVGGSIYISPNKA